MAGGKITRVYRAPAGRKLNFRQVKQVQKIVNANKQLKQCWTPVDQSPSSTTPYFLELTQLAEGEDFNQRDSDLVSAIGLNLKFTINRLAATTNSTVSTVRMMVVRSKVGPLVVGDLPASPASATMPNLTKYQVLYERFISIGPYDSDGIFIDTVCKDISVSFKFRKGKIPHLGLMYDDGVSATACQKNAIYLYLDNSDATTLAAVGQSVLKYYDKD